MSQVIAEPSVPVTETTIESVLLDADLFVKYSSPEKAFELLRSSLERSPRSLALREKMRDICVRQKNLNEAARQCLALVSLYIAREDFDVAYDRLQEAKLQAEQIPTLEAEILKLREAVTTAQLHRAQKEEYSRASHRANEAAKADRKSTRLNSSHG